MPRVLPVVLLVLLLLAPAPLVAQYVAEDDSFALAAADVPLRAAPAPGAVSAGMLRVGTIVQLHAASPDGNWRAVRTHALEGWAAADLLMRYDPNDPLAGHVELARVWLDTLDVGLAALTAVVDALTLRLATSAEDSDQRAELEFLRYRVMQRALDVHAGIWVTLPETWHAALPWLLLHADELVYGEPQGSWLVHGALLWEIVDRVQDAVLSEEIAWYAASRVAPGECEGYLPCVFHRAQETLGAYLAYHPAGAHAHDALAGLEETFDFMLEYATDEFGHPELCEEVVRTGMLGELRFVVEAAPPGAARDSALARIDAVAATCSATHLWRKT